MDDIAYRSAHREDRWTFNKLEVGMRAGWVCGPCGEAVPQDGEYIIRPVMNVHGMGRGAWAEHLEEGDFHEAPGYFWCLRGNDDHQISVDYERKHGQWIPTLVVRGDKPRNAPMHRFERWTKLPLDEAIPAPGWLSGLAHDGTLNLEFVDGKVIEVHLRHNPDFQSGEEVIVPIWHDDTLDWTYEAAVEFGRCGFAVGRRRE